MSFSDQQLDIAREVETGRGNIIVMARAGTGKSKIIRDCLPLMSGTVAVLAFGSEIAKEMAAKVAAAGHKADIGTFHSFGNRALRRAFPKAKMEGHGPKNTGFMKFTKIAEELEVPGFLRPFVRKAMDLGMSRGFGVLSPLNDPKQWLDLCEHYNLDGDLADDNVVIQLHGRDKVIKQALQFACKAIKRGIEMVDEVISFGDMLYIPLVLNMKFDQFDYVVVDEAQDSNDLRCEMARRMTKPGGRMMFCGDAAQSIFAFTGADCDSMEKIQARFNCKIMPMTMTFRCSKAVVELAKSIVPDYVAAPQNPQGSVNTIGEDSFYKMDLTPEDAILCRNTKPLVQAAHQLIKRGIACHVEGRDIGVGLLNLVGRFQVKTISALTDKLRDYQSREVEKLMKAEKEMLADALIDQVETLFVMISSLNKGDRVEQLVAKIEAMFSDTSAGEKRKSVALMTIHRSKGREMTRVFHLGRAKFIPSKGAKKPHELEQEKNLEYVSISRAIMEYYDVVVA